MENKNGSFLIIVMIVIIVMNVFMYMHKTESDKQIKELKNSESEMSENTNDIQGKNENIVDSEKTSNISSENSVDNKYLEITKELRGIDVLFVTDAIENSNNTYTLKGVIYTQYTISHKELTEILEKGSMLIGGKEYTIKSSDIANEYDLFEKNSEYVLYKLKPINFNEYYLETEAQVSDNWKLTEDYRQITLPGDMLCAGDAGNETVEDVFKNYKKATPTEVHIIPSGINTFGFVFENGKIKNIYRAEYSV